jgi:solute carrier family 35 protein E3
VVGLSKTLNNVSLKYNSMGVYQIFKLLVTPAIVALEYCLDGRVLSGRRAICLAFVCLFCVGSINGDLQISTSGLAWATVWLPFAAIFKVQWARVKRRYNCSTVSLMNAVMPYACFLQLAIAPVVDPPGLFTYQWTLQTVLLLTMSAFGAFFVLYSSFLVLGHVGPLSHTLLGPLKTATTMMGSAVLFKTRYSATQLVTATGALLSLAAYTHVTVTEQRQHKQEQEGIPLLAVSSIKSTEPSSNKQVDNGDDTVTTAASTSSNGDEEDPLILLIDEEDKLPDHEMDDSDRTFV